ncbi:MAG: aromatic amino acid lyase [Parachlamydiaceae bacterium]|nr:aromatic amino acid lyase [Parachlamydiaceae bacterium]
MIYLGKRYPFGFKEFREIVFQKKPFAICPFAAQRLEETRSFIEALLAENIKVYGLTTGFADLRHQSVDPHSAAQLSCNLIESHDAGIGASLDPDVILGAMVVRASSLAKGYSGFQLRSLNTLLEMIQHNIIPIIPKTGSLGASGDLAFLARVGRAMMGAEVPVWHHGVLTTAAIAFKNTGIEPFEPLAKEGLAMTNGTSFMISSMAIAFLKQLHALENILAMQGLFLNSVEAIDAAFNDCIQGVRNQSGQTKIAKVISKHFVNSPFIDFTGVQDDYCIRCLPQLLGSKIEIILEQYSKIQNELNAVTDNPLLFKEDEISSDVDPRRIFQFKGENWAVLSGGNFHGEIITTIADVICAANAKIALTLERQITYMLNPFRNKNRLPTYLIPNSEEVGLSSGYMITQYTANALAQKIAQFGIPTSIFNITSANESEDVVSYGATAVERLLQQVQLLKELNTIYLCVALQAYSIARQKKIAEGSTIPSELLAERLFQESVAFNGETFPHVIDASFDKRYEKAQKFLDTDCLREIMGFPLEALVQDSLEELIVD